MNPQLQERVLNWISVAATKVEDFATTQIPPFIEEFLTWKFYESLVDVGIWGFVTILWFILGLIGVVWITKLGRRDGEEPSAFFIALIISVITILFMLMALPLKEIKTCIQIKVAPKVYLVEYGAKLIKDNK